MGLLLSVYVNYGVRNMRSWRKCISPTRLKRLLFYFNFITQPYLCWLTHDTCCYVSYESISSSSRSPPYCVHNALMRSAVQETVMHFANILLLPLIGSSIVRVMRKRHYGKCGGDSNQVWIIVLLRQLNSNHYQNK